MSMNKNMHTQIQVCKHTQTISYTHRGGKKLWFSISYHSQPVQCFSFLFSLVVHFLNVTLFYATSCFHIIEDGV